MRLSKAITFLMITLTMLISACAATNSSGPFIPEHHIPANIKPELRTLVDGLYSSKAQVRADSANELGAMSKVAVPAVPFLISMLEDQHEADDNMVTGKIPDVDWT